MSNEHLSGTVTRRGLLAGASGLALAAALAGCSGQRSASGALKFWNMPWGGTTFAPLDKKITLAYKPASGMPAATYQSIQWSNFTATFASAVASKTGPAVSSGSGTQAFQFARQGNIAYADGLLDSWKSNGLYDDFLPGVLESMKTSKGYVAVPYNLDMRVLWYRKSLLEKAGVTPPTDWQSYLDACQALKSIGVYGFGAASGAQGNAFQSIVGLMINNGGGIFDAAQKPNCVTSTNIEALDFVVELVKKGYMDPGTLGYSTTNEYSQWKVGKFGMGWEGPGLAQNVGGDAASDMIVADPIVGAQGKKGGIYFPNNIMMYTNTPSQKDSEAFMTYYFKNMAPLWTQNTGIGLPVLKSIASTSAVTSDPNNVTMIEKWQPICKTWAAPGGNALFANVSLVDSTPAMTTFAQSLLSLKATPKEALTTLQTTLQSEWK
ncbi:ABC transporter substrate-binding protein [Curtobacterium ammoniigenes]|uniref:ABC transporter substrate-binding protein n=1 Tax=Curtobacterium ammoniigenes TaxID=395387 RepID=UPI00082BD9C6|nr:extracellular solute-binding protein [Curtobacterium ammoniigenes]